jgi:hypothetical protein
VLIHPGHKAVVLKLKEPAKITTVIPTAKPFMWGGHQFVAIPHRLDEVKVLRNLGHRAPSPVLHHYKWPGGSA